MQDENTAVSQDEIAASGDAQTAAATQSVDELRAELDAANAKAKENYEKFLLAMADFENYKKRMEKGIVDRVSAAHKRVLAAFLPVIDNLERALSYEGDNAESLRNGLQQTLKGFQNVLTMEGVAPIDVKGQPFDPAVAEAIGTQPAADGVADDTVLEVAQKGYKFGDELLRPAQVIVAKTQDATE